MGEDGSMKVTFRDVDTFNLWVRAIGISHSVGTLPSCLCTIPWVRMCHNTRIGACHHNSESAIKKGKYSACLDIAWHYNLQMQ